MIEPDSIIERITITDFVIIESFMIEPSQVSDSVTVAWLILQGGRLLGCEKIGFASSKRLNCGFDVVRSSVAS